MATCPVVIPIALAATNRPCAPMSAGPPAIRISRSLLARVAAAAPAEAMIAMAHMISHAAGIPGNASKPRNIELPRITYEIRSVREAELRASRPPTTVAATSEAPEASAESRMAKAGGRPRTEIE